MGDFPHRYPGHPALWALTGALGFTVACAGVKLPPPEQRAQEIAEALEQEDVGRLHAMLTKRAQEQLSPEELRELLQESPAEYRELREQLQALTQQELTQSAWQVEARLPFTNGSEIFLRGEQGEFRLQGSGVSSAGAASPEAALLELHQTLRRQSLPGLLALLSAQKKQELTGLLEALTEATTAEQLEFAEVELLGERAQVRLPSGLLISLVRESGVWKLEEVQ